MRDMERKKEMDKKYRDNYDVYRVKIRKDSGIMEKIAKSGMGPSEFAKQALTEKLIRDGYLNSKE